MAGYTTFVDRMAEDVTLFKERQAAGVVAEELR